MSDLRSEFGFIPPELIYICDMFVKAFHKKNGSSKDFVAASMMFSEESTYLTSLQNNMNSIFKVTRALVILAAVILIVAALTTMWLALALLPVGMAILYLWNMMGDMLIQQRAIILAVEVLATDFAGWGQLFRRARGSAEVMFARDAGDWPKLIDLYLPSQRRADPKIVTLFAPSDGSVASAT